MFNPLNAELNPICYLLALLGAHHFLHVSRIRVKSLTLRLLISYIYIYIYIYDISSLRVNLLKRQKDFGKNRSLIEPYKKVRVSPFNQSDSLISRKLVQAAILVAYFRKMPNSILSRRTDSPICEVCGLPPSLPPSLHPCKHRGSTSDYDRFLPYSFQFIVQSMSYHSALRTT